MEKRDMFWQKYLRLEKNFLDIADNIIITDVLRTIVDGVENISNDKLKLLFDEVLNIEFLDLQNPEIREIDKIWARILFDCEGEKLLSIAKDYLMYVSNRRNT